MAADHAGIQQYLESIAFLHASFSDAFNSPCGLLFTNPRLSSASASGRLRMWLEINVPVMEWDAECLIDKYFGGRSCLAVR